MSALSDLQSLDIFHNQISDISVLSALSDLEFLYLGSNKIVDISFLKGLTQLDTLYLDNNLIENTSPLSELTSLKRVSLSGNRIKDITALIPLTKKAGLWITLGGSDSGINVKGNPITTPPLEIVKQGLEAIYEWEAAHKKQLEEIKIILIGEAKAGKTSLLKRLKHGTFETKEEQTDGVNIVDIPFGDNKQFKNQEAIHHLTGHFWDFGGQEIMSATHQFFLTNRSVYILVLDARKDNQIADQIRKWVQRIRSTGGNSPILVVSNQIDINKGFGFENENELKREFPQIKGFHKVSCASEEGLEELKNQLAKVIPEAELFRTEIDERWITLIGKLREKSKGKYLSKNTFDHICTELSEKGQKRRAITFFHDLGLVLHFEDIGKNLSDYYILDPYWITYGVYQILTSSKAAEHYGKVPMKELDFIINEELDKVKAYKPERFERINYSPNEQRFLVDILHEFKLCYYLTDRSHFIIPDLLETKEPVELTDAIREDQKAIRLVYDYEYLPKSIIPQIMTKEHERLDYVWRTGCILTYRDCKGLISSYDNKLWVYVVGDIKIQRELMGVIRYLMDSIHHDLPNKPNLTIPLPGFDNEFVDYGELLERDRDGEKYYTVYKPRKERFEIKMLLEGIPDEDEIKRMLKDLKKDHEMIIENQEIILGRLNANYSDIIHQIDNLDFRNHLEKSLREVNLEQAELLKQDMMSMIGNAFEIHGADIDEKLISIHKDLKNTDNTQLKLKVGLPLISLLGVNIEGEFDIKSWYQEMYKKYKLEIFKTMGYLK